jgi:hypothetical protein
LCCALKVRIRRMSLQTMRNDSYHENRDQSQNPNVTELKSEGSSAYLNPKDISASR